MAFQDICRLGMPLFYRMPNLRAIIVSICVAMAFGCSLSPSRANQDSVSEASAACKPTSANPNELVRRVGNVICLKGAITAASRDHFFSLSPRDGDIIVASGPGGDIAAAMDIGDFIYEHDLLVIVDDLCGSSCSYFIALGGKRLAIYGNGLLGFHGGPIPKEEIKKIPDISAKNRKKVIADNRRFSKFFGRRKLDIRITYEIPEASKEDGTDWKTSMWVRWPTELANFGFMGLISCSGTYCKSP